MPYIGTSPSNGVRRVHTYTATASQTTFTGASSEGVTLSYVDTNYIDVFQNGVLLGSADYTSTSGTSVVLAQGASVDDLIVIVVYDVFSVADTVSKTNGGTFDGTINFAQNPTVSSVPLTNTPAFEAYVSATVENFTDNTAAKMPANTEVFDSDGKYDTSNYRFTPTVAGKYFIYAGAIPRSESNFDILVQELYIYKNGSEYRWATMRPTNSNNSNENHITIQAIMDLDADDYVEIYANCNTTSNAQWKFQERNKSNYFGAYKLIGI